MAKKKRTSYVGADSVVFHGMLAHVLGSGKAAEVRHSSSHGRHTETWYVGGPLMPHVYPSKPYARKGSDACTGWYTGNAGYIGTVIGNYSYPESRKNGKL